MKKSVLDINDLKEKYSFFRSNLGCFIGNRLLKWLNVDKVNEIHAKRLFFIHPITGEEMRFETRIPDMFSSLVR